MFPRKLRVGKLCWVPNLVGWYLTVEKGKERTFFFCFFFFGGGDISKLPNYYYELTTDFEVEE